MRGAFLATDCAATASGTVAAVQKAVVAVRDDAGTGEGHEDGPEGRRQPLDAKRKTAEGPMTPHGARPKTGSRAPRAGARERPGRLR